MKLLGISASNRRDGNSYLILKEALPDAEIIQFADLEIKPCTHCEHNRNIIGKEHNRVRSCNIIKEIAEYLGIHYTTVSRAVKRIEEKDKM